MRLKKLLGHLEYAVIQGAEKLGELTIQRVVYDSRKAGRGDLFVCLSGANTDGHRFIGEAAQKGASAFVVEKLVLKGKALRFPANAVVILVRDSREALAHISAVYFGNPAAKLKIIGVTGTKGKTTVTCMIRTLLERAGHKTGLIGTIETVIGEERIPSENTTPESFTIQEYFAKMVEEECEYAVMEVSSQGMKQKRVEGISFLAAVFTNFGEDHIGPGEHETMEEYRYYKSRLFRVCQIGIGNLDDLQCSYMFRHAKCEKYGYTCQKDFFSLLSGKKEKVFAAEQIRFQMENGTPVTCFRVRGEEFCLQMPGLFNVYNALAALTTVHALGITVPGMAGALREMKVRGRMELVTTDKNIACYIDYAHNAMSLAQALTTVREYQPGRIILVFGCGGNRSISRRTEMGEVAGRLADLTVITSDNPRFEEPGKIMEDIRAGMEKTEGEFCMVEDRGEAIRFALREARQGDVVLIAGKGHETYQEIRGVKYPMDDRELVRMTGENCEMGERRQIGETCEIGGAT